MADYADIMGGNQGGSYLTDYTTNTTNTTNTTPDIGSTSNTISNDDDEGHYDVYFARGHKYDLFPGNELYRQSIRNYFLHYKEAPSTKEKKIIVNRVIDSICSKGGRFYHQTHTQKKQEDVYCREISPHSIILQNKVRQALRDAYNKALQEEQEFGLVTKLGENICHKITLTDQDKHKLRHNQKIEDQDQSYSSCHSHEHCDSIAGNNSEHHGGEDTNTNPYQHTKYLHVQHESFNTHTTNHEDKKIVEHQEDTGYDPHRQIKVDKQDEETYEYNNFTNIASHDNQLLQLSPFSPINTTKRKRYDFQENQKTPQYLSYKQQHDEERHQKGQVIVTGKQQNSASTLLSKPYTTTTTTNTNTNDANNDLIWYHQRGSTQYEKLDNKQPHLEQVHYDSFDRYGAEGNSIHCNHTKNGIEEILNETMNEDINRPILPISLDANTSNLPSITTYQQHNNLDCNEDQDIKIKDTKFEDADKSISKLVTKFTRSELDEIMNHPLMSPSSGSQDRSFFLSFSSSSMEKDEFDSNYKAGS